jgi:hypothetical protein
VTGVRPTQEKVEVQARMRHQAASGASLIILKRLRVMCAMVVTMRGSDWSCHWSVLGLPVVIALLVVGQSGRTARQRPPLPPHAPTWHPVDECGSA